MSCNGCRVLRKGCSEECMLRYCLQWIENLEGQAHATLFVDKFFGRATLMSFLSLLVDACEKIQGAYSIVFLTEDKLVAVRGSFNFRPLVMGRCSNDAVVFASET
ncbi:hypothetical protein Fmac_001610 [Flemingia macrophylla]|uniref:LOB domain-containing protein n=1 Tax=Flemingia macrophylla TaxID=520843 RepID=A0ABD1NHK6_9FABA